MNTTKNSTRYRQYFFLLGLLMFTPMAVLAEAPPALPELIDETSEHFTDIESANLDGLLERIGDSRLVLLGEASHGTREFYQMRARITRELIEKKGFTIVAVEADWPDAESIDHYIRGSGYKPRYKDKPFAGFPSWMWRNHSMLAFTRWLKGYNQRFDSSQDAIAFYGLDLYNIYNSIEAVLVYLQQVNPESAETARRNYACLMPWSNDPSEYSHVMRSGRHHGCSHEVEAVLLELRKLMQWIIARKQLRLRKKEFPWRTCITSVQITMTLKGNMMLWFYKVFWNTWISHLKSWLICLTSSFVKEVL